MNRTVYFADRAVAFTAEAPGGAWYAVAAEACGGISRAKILNFLESHNSVAVVSDDPDRAFAAFAAEFTPVEAAGGVVVNDCGEWLMIHRNGRWDLPKGHLECGERIEECAAREVEEETGVAARVVRPLCETLHAYYFPKTARWELKRIVIKKHPTDFIMIIVFVWCALCGFIRRRSSSPCWLRAAVFLLTRTSS